MEGNEFLILYVCVGGGGGGGGVGKSNSVVITNNLKTESALNSK